MEIIKKTTFDRLYAIQIATMAIKEGSFIAVSKRLGISPSNVTKEIQKLEEYFGVQLFKRTTRSIALTQEGKVAIDKAREVLNSFGDLEANLKGSVTETRGTLNITAPTTLGQSLLADIFANYQIKNPFIDIDLRFTDRILDPIEQGVDLSIRTAFSLKDSSLYVKRLGKLERVVVASKKYIDKFGVAKSPDALFNHNCLLYMRGDSPFIWSFSKGSKTKNIHVQGSYRSNNLLSLIKACEKGVGALNIPRYLVEDLIQNGKLVVLLKSWSIPAHNIFLLSTRKPSKSKRIESILNFLTDSLSS